MYKDKIISLQRSGALKIQALALRMRPADLVAAEGVRRECRELERMALPPDTASALEFS